MKKYSANTVTCIRSVGCFSLFLLVPFSGQADQQWFFIGFVILSCTDWIDGFLARSKWGQITDFGKLMDPIADKVLVLVYLPLIQMQVIGSFPVFLILFREFIITALRTMAAKNGNIIPAKFSGKVKTAIYLVVASILICRVEFESSLFLISWVQSVTIFSLVDYLIEFRKN